MQIKINGKPEEVREETVLHLLKSRNIEPQMVTVELNSKILQREELSKALLKEGDEVEFLFFMGGGADLSGPITPPRKAF
jgi:sulfur carrier protein